MTSKILFLFFQTKIVEEDASSQLSQSTGIYSSGQLDFNLKELGGLRGGRGQENSKENGGVQVSLPKYVNSLYRISLNKELNCCLLSDFCT